MLEHVTFTPAQERILEAVRRGSEPLTAARAAGVSDENIRQWRAIAAGAKTWPGSQSPVAEGKREIIVAFVSALAQAEAEGFQALLERLQHNANTQNLRTGWYDTQAIDKILSKSAFRKFWYEREPEQDPAREQHPAYLEARGLSVDELERRLMEAGVDDPALPAASTVEDAAARAREDGAPPGGWTDEGVGG